MKIMSAQVFDHKVWVRGLDKEKMRTFSVTFPENELTEEELEILKSCDPHGNCEVTLVKSHD